MSSLIQRGIVATPLPGLIYSAIDNRLHDLQFHYLVKIFYFLFQTQSEESLIETNS